MACTQCVIQSSCAYSASEGHLECLQYLLSSNVPIEKETTIEASKHGHLHILRFLFENQYCEQECSWGFFILFEAVSHGHLECLRYAHEHGCELENNVLCNLAAKNGYLDCLHYLRVNGCPWD